MPEADPPSRRLIPTIAEVIQHDIGQHRTRKVSKQKRSAATIRPPSERFVKTALSMEPTRVQACYRFVLEGDDAFFNVEEE